MLTIERSENPFNVNIFHLKGTEELLKREASIKDDDVRPQATSQSETDVSHALAAYKRYATLSCSLFVHIFRLIISPIYTTTRNHMMRCLLKPLCFYNHNR